jgi:cysteine synthase A
LIIYKKAVFIIIINCITEYIGNTPLLKIRGNENEGNVFVKLEEFNPGGSIKTRIAFRMILDAQKHGILEPFSGQTIIEPTGGNTGIGLAIAGASLGYRVILVVPDSFSKEKINVLKAYGAEVILSDHKTGNDSHIKKANELAEKHPNYIYLNQFKNLSNPKAHYESTADEIVNDFKTENLTVDAFVSSIGSGGTITGVGSKLKQVYTNLRLIGVQPEGCDILRNKFIQHRIQATAVGIVTPFLAKEIIDEMYSVTFEEAVYWMHYMAKHKGVLVGISSGANIAAAKREAKVLGASKNIVTVAPDSGKSYIEIFNESKEKELIG